MNITATAVAVTLAVVVAVAFLFFGPGIFQPFNGGAVSEVASTDQQQPMDSSDSIVSALAGGEALPTTLSVKDSAEGQGAAAKKGDVVTVHYVGALPDGTVFDASARHGQPFTFQLGAGEVIRGWDEGIVGMKVGGKRMLVIPPDMGYGAQGAGGVIPPNATLVFEVELLKIGQ